MSPVSRRCVRVGGLWLVVLLLAGCAQRSTGSAAACPSVGATTRVPNVVGVEVERAYLKLMRAGLLARTQPTGGVQSGPTPPPVPPGTVVSQAPQGGRS